jgi:hypothetical protein
MDITEHLNKKILPSDIKCHTRTLRFGFNILNELLSYVILCFGRIGTEPALPITSEEKQYPIDLV